MSIFAAFIRSMLIMFVTIVDTIVSLMCLVWYGNLFWKLYTFLYVCIDKYFSLVLSIESRKSFYFGSLLLHKFVVNSADFSLSIRRFRGRIVSLKSIGKSEGYCSSTYTISCNSFFVLVKTNGLF